MIPGGAQSHAVRHRNYTAYRYPWNQPFTASGIWNLGFGSGAQWTTSADAGTTQLQAAGGAINTDASGWHQPVYIGSASDPTVTFTTSNGGDFPCTPQTMHCPASARPTSQSDHHMNVFDKTQPRYMWSFFDCTLNNGTDLTGGVTAYFGGVFDVTTDGGRPAVVPGTTGVYNYGVGVIRDWELSAGAINHMLRCALGGDMLKSPGQTYTSNIPWPDVAEDYSGAPTTGNTYTGNIIYGSTMGIPPSVNLSTLGLTADGMILARCLQKYGLLIRDRSSNTTVVLYTDILSSGNVTRVSNMASDFNTILTKHLCILTNQSTDGSAGTVNGGGTYPPTVLAPYDPALGIGSGY